MFLAIVNCGLIALESGLVNPFQAFLLINGYSCAGHQKPACSKLCLSITAIGCQLIPESTFLQILFYAVTIPICRAAVFLALNMSLESSLAIPKECFRMILLCAVTEVVGVCVPLVASDQRLSGSSPWCPPRKPSHDSYLPCSVPWALFQLLTV